VAARDAGDPFTGFGPQVHDFFAALAEHNDRDWFLAHKPDYRTSVREPFEALLAELEPVFGPGRLFRINRDVRFSADKSPYKTVQGAVIERGERGTLYVQVNAEGAMVGAGVPQFDPGQLRRYREAVAGDAGAELATLVARLRRSSFAVGTLDDGDVADGVGDLKRVPTPYPADHPRADLLKLKRIIAARSFERPAWLRSHAAVDRITSVWQRLDPLGDWLAEHVGAPTAARR
jgi:uncharacterized protein (TIGR02453 family)